MQYSCQFTEIDAIGRSVRHGETVMRRFSFFCLVMLLGSLAVFLTGCSRDPNVRRQKYFESGQRYFAKGKYREAAIQYSNAVQVDPRFTDAHYQLAQTYLKLQEWTRAYQELSRTIEDRKSVV